MSAPTLYLGGRVAVHSGDCLATIKILADNSVDACVTDPPYALVSITKRFGKTALADETGTADRSRKGADGYARLAKGFMGKAWDTGETAFSVDFWREVLRVLKPGGHVVAFGGTRSYHRLACAIEDAGFEIRDSLMWLYGTGFPKSHSVDKSIDKLLGVKGAFGDAKSPAHERYIKTGELRGQNGHEGWQRPWMDDPAAVENAARRYLPASDEARAWEGWGTALKPAWEPICLARKPLSEKTIAANVLRWGTGAINVGACRVGTDGGCAGAGAGAGAGAVVFGDGLNGRFAKPVPGLGRWPANIVIDDSQEVRDAFPDSEGGASGGNATPRSIGTSTDIHGVRSTVAHNDSGSAARFFFRAKADADDRLGSKHPTVKPLALMQWLCKLICPPGGTILDPFAGTGTTGEAAWREDFNAVLCEREAEYLADIARRMKLCLAGPDERARESIKARDAGKPGDHGPLFGGTEYAGGGRQIYGTFADQLGRSDRRGSNGEDR